MFSLRWAGGAELHHAGSGWTAPLQSPCHVPIRSGKTQSLLTQESGKTLSKAGCHSWLIFPSGWFFWSQANVGLFLIHSSSYSKICLIFKQHKCCTRQQKQEDNPQNTQILQQREGIYHWRANIVLSISVALKTFSVSIGGVKPSVEKRDVV